MIDGLFKVIDLFTDDLPIAVANVYRSHPESNSGRSASREFLSPEVVYMLGKVKGVWHYYYGGVLYFYEGSQDPTMTQSTLKLVSSDDITTNIITAILKNLAGYSDSKQEREVHTGGFFIFRYLLKCDGVQKRCYTAIRESSPEKAINAFRGRSEQRYILEHAEDIKVYSFGKWMCIKKMPPMGDMRSVTSGRPLTTLELADKTATQA